MSQGIRKWDADCPFCGEVYFLTNWMRRRKDIRRVNHHGEIVRLDDTHLLGCYARAAAVEKED